MRIPKNNNLPRTIDCIYLRPTPDMPNGHNLINLYTGELIMWPMKMITVCEMSRDIVQRVEVMALRQGVQSLKLKYRKSEDWLPIFIEQEMQGDLDGESNDDADYVPDSILNNILESNSDSDDELPDDDDNDESGGGDNIDDVDNEHVAEIIDSEPQEVDCQINHPQEQL